jgi:hypothetical protein
MLTTRQYLRNLDKETLKKLFVVAQLPELEYWLVYYTFIDKKLRANVCRKLNIGSTKYATTLNEALIKIEYTINNLDKLRNLC